MIVFLHLDCLWIPAFLLQCIPPMFIGNLQLQVVDDITMMPNRKICREAGKGEQYCTENVHVNQRPKTMSLQ